MCLLERCVGCAADPAREPPLSARESIEAPSSGRSSRGKPRLPVSAGRHPGGVVEASDVRGDERREHCWNSIARTRRRYRSPQDRAAAERARSAVPRARGWPERCALRAPAGARGSSCRAAASTAGSRATPSAADGAGPDGRRGEDAAEPDGGDGHRRDGRRERAGRSWRRDAGRSRSAARAARAEPRGASGQAADRRAELAARRAAREMASQQRALERRQLAVEVGRCPLTGALTLLACMALTLALTAAHVAEVSGMSLLQNEGVPRVDERRRAATSTSAERDEDRRVVDRLVLLVERRPADPARRRGPRSIVDAGRARPTSRARGRGCRRRSPATSRKQPTR